MADPQTKEEFEALTVKNTQYEGYGPETTSVFPCPFCAAAGWLRHKIVDFDYESMQRGATCGSCGRTARFKVAREGSGVSVTLLQTGGDDPPEWVPIAREADSPDA